MLRRIKTGSTFGGVCMGLAKWSDMDVTIWRLIFVLGTLFTVIPFPVTYLAMWILVPKEEKPEQNG